MKKKSFAKNILIAMIMVTMCMFIPAGPVFADCAENGEGLPAEEAGCMSEPADRILTLDMIPGGKSEKKDAGIGIKNIVDTSRNIPILVVVIGFENAKYSTEYDWGSLLFEGERSLLNYYSDMSYGQFTFAPVNETSKYGKDGNGNIHDKINDGIIHVKLDMDHEDWDKRDAAHAEAGREMTRAFTQAANTAMDYVDKSAFIALDRNSDGKLTEEELALAFIVGGYDSGVSDAIKNHSANIYMNSHRWSLSGTWSTFSMPNSERVLPKVESGGNTATMDAYVAISERCERSSGVCNGRVSSLAHELGHHLGLPDLYDTGTSAESKPWANYKVGKMSLMGTGTWTLDESSVYKPLSMDPWSKSELGWITPQSMDSAGTYTATAQDYSNRKNKNNVLKVPADVIDSSRASDEEEYYLIESRRANKWDWALRNMNVDSWKTKDGKGGLVFWHIDEKVLKTYTQGSKYKNVNTPDHRPGVMPLYLENNYTNWLSDGTIVATSTPFFDKYNWERHADILTVGDKEEIWLPKYGSAELTDGPIYRSNSRANVQILSDAGSSMKIAYWDDDHRSEHDWGYSYHVYPEDYCEKGGTWYIYADCRICGKKELKSQYYEAEPPGHQWYKEVTEEPGYNHKGKAHWLCQVCRKEIDVTIPALLEKGSSEEDTDQALKKYSSEKDPKGTKFSKLKLKSTKQTKTSIKLSWKKAGAKKYVIYGSKCGKSNKLHRIKKVTSTSTTIKKIAGKKLKAKKYYKFIVVALDNNGDVVSTSKMIHVATKGSKSKSNYKSVYVSKKILAKAKKLKKGKKLSLKAKAKTYKGCKVVKHVGLRYQSSNTKIVKVTSKGTLKGIKKGNAKVWVYAQNGKCKTVKVTVK